MIIWNVKTPQELREEMREQILVELDILFKGYRDLKNISMYDGAHDVESRNYLKKILIGTRAMGVSSVQLNKYWHKLEEN